MTRTANRNCIEVTVFKMIMNRLGPRRAVGLLGSVLSVVLSLPGCSANHPEPSKSELHAMAETCEFSDGARAKLASLGFFSVGDDQELFLDRELSEGALGMSDISLAGVKWFYAYPRCDSKSVSYSDLPSLLKNNIPEHSALVGGPNQSTFIREGYPTDLTILSFEDFRIAFYVRRP